MSDEVDVANDYAERELADRLYRRVQYSGGSATHCRDCDEAIPAARRALIPGVMRCTDCQQIEDRRRG